MSYRRPLSFRDDEKDLVDIFDSENGGSSFVKDAIRFYLKYKENISPSITDILKLELKNEIKNELKIEVKAEILIEIITLLTSSGLQSINIKTEQSNHDEKIIKNARKSLVK